MTSQRALKEGDDPKFSGWDSGSSRVLINANEAGKRGG